MNRGTVVATAAIAMPLLLCSAACSPGGPSSSPSDPSTPSGGRSSSSGGAGSNALNGKGGLPKDFPMPSDVSSVQSSTVGARISVTMRLSDGARDYDFWVHKLPEAGYTVGQNNKNPGGGLLSFNGNGYRIGTIAVRTGSAAIVMTK
jgi:hypothetical protein